MSSVTDSVGLVLTTLVIVARCYTKFSLTKASGREDCKWCAMDSFALRLNMIDADVCILAYLAFVTYSALDFTQRFQFGGG